ncbi:Arginyl-tRNA--protein transferase 1 [Savitreella phatthalungensis]
MGSRRTASSSSSMTNPQDMLEYTGYVSESRCGYCGSPTGSRSFGVWAHALSPGSYKKLMDRGWRRSGSYLYKPNIALACCALYTIRLDPRAFSAHRTQRHALNKFNRFVLGKEAYELAVKQERESEHRPQKRQRKDNENASSFDLSSAVHLAEQHSLKSTAHRWEISLEAASPSEEKFDVYLKYQVDVHNDDPADVTAKGFDRFLCQNPLSRERIPYAADKVSDDLPTHYGAYHQVYRLDGTIIALAVIDVLPGAVSSVYFAYDPEYAHLSLGRVSACRETLLARELDEAVPSVDFHYYMGYYIPDCAKMAYKGEYSPSFLADPVSLTWEPLTRFADAWKKHPEDLRVTFVNDYTFPPRQAQQPERDEDAVSLMTGLFDAPSIDRIGRSVCIVKDLGSAGRVVTLSQLNTMLTQLDSRESSPHASTSDNSADDEEEERALVRRKLKSHIRQAHLRISQLWRTLGHDIASAALLII